VLARDRPPGRAHHRRRGLRLRPLRPCRALRRLHRARPGRVLLGWLSPPGTSHQGGKRPPANPADRVRLGIPAPPRCRLGPREAPGRRRERDRRPGLEGPAPPLRALQAPRLAEERALGRRRCSGARARLLSLGGDGRLRTSRAALLVCPGDGHRRHQRRDMPCPQPGVKGSLRTCAALRFSLSARSRSLRPLDPVLWTWRGAARETMQEHRFSDEADTVNDGGEPTSVRLVSPERSVSG
jgi:hypothetical protein